MMSSSRLEERIVFISSLAGAEHTFRAAGWTLGCSWSWLVFYVGVHRVHVLLPEQEIS